MDYIQRAGLGNGGLLVCWNTFDRLLIMNRVSLWIVVAVAVVSFASGFLIANLLNRTEINSLKAEASRLSADSMGSQRSDNEPTLTDEEIESKLNEAKENSGNFQYQKNLGIALYRYGAIKKDASLIERAIPLLERAQTLVGKDIDVTVALGNAHFDQAYLKKENLNFEKARRYYIEALAARPTDVEIRTNLGLTYFLQDPPDQAAAYAEFQKSLAADPNHVKTLQFAIQSLTQQGKDATELEKRLKALDPGNIVLSEAAPISPPHSPSR